LQSTTLARIERVLLIALGALAVTYALIPAAAPFRVVFGHLALCAAPAAAALMCARAAHKGARGAIPTWILLALGAAGVACAQAIWAVRQIALQQPMPFPSFSYYLFLAFHPLFAAALLASLREGEHGSSRIDLAQDALLACAAVALVLLRFLFEPLRAARPWLTYPELVWIVGGQFLAQLSVVAAGVLVIWRRSVLSPRAAVAIVIVALMNGIANLLLVAGVDPNPGSPGDAFDLLWLFSWLLLAAAGAAGAISSDTAWTGRDANWLSIRLRQSIAPLTGLILGGTALHIAFRGSPATETVFVMAVLAVLLALRLMRTLGAVDREQRKRHELARTRILVELSRTLATAPRVADALTHVVASARQLLGVRRAWVERAPLDGDVRIAASFDGDPGAMIPVERSCGLWLGERRVAQVLTSGELHATGPHGAPIESHCWLAAATLRFGDRVAGTLAVERSDRGFDAAELDLLGALADQAAVAIENGRLVEEAHQAERTRLRSEKLASLGQLVAGVAHEINNPLAAIHSAAEMLATDGMRDDPSWSVEIIRTEATRAARIVRRMLDFVRPTELIIEPLDVGELVEAALRPRAQDHLDNGIGTHVRLAGLPPVYADPGPLQQVFLNLIMNAEHAMARSSSERRIEITGRVEAHNVAIRIHDTGVGIAPENLGRVFDPFFTTKPVGQGTGLGLSVSYGILREMGGTISAESAPGDGATFTVRLPIAVPAAVGVPEPAPPASPAVQAAEPLSILLVDDEASIRHLVARFLRRRGHTVQTAENGRLALDALVGNDFAVILTDLKMPVLDGEAFYEQLLLQGNGHASRVLFMSGDTVAESTRNFLMHTSRPFISKPFDLEFLAERIAEVGRRALAG
jgi:signal transduction histidine kinase/CheY-like chemotaxis protein